jgi:uncharacterized membrane protein/protein-disulfide isomerase
MNSTKRRLLLACSLLGLAAATASSVVHYRLLTRPGYTSFCDVNATVSCTEAYLSRFGSFWGVPVALGGVFFFALVFVVVAIAGRQASPARENAPAYVFVLSTLALAFVLYLAWASFFVLKAFCMLCGVTYLAVIAIFIISGGATSFPMITLPRRALRDLRAVVVSPLALLIAVGFIGGAAAAVAMFPHEAIASTEAQAPSEFPPLTDAQRAQFTQWWDAQEKVDMPLSNDGAKVLIVKFNDYQCPPCRQSYEGYKGIIGKYVASGDAKFILKHYPLEPECNAAVPNGMHLAACEAAAAVIMARSKGTAEKLEQWLFDNQAALDGSKVRQAARDVGGIQDFDAQYQRALQEVKADAGLGALLGVQSTPTFFINGRRIRGMLDPRAFDAAIQLELERAKSRTK